jgi:hypothetical protein
MRATETPGVARDETARVLQERASRAIRMRQ